MSADSDLNLYLVTFNCARAFVKPEAFASHFFDGLSDTTSRNQPPDLIVLHLQELAPLSNSFNNYGLTKYYDRFKAALRLAVKQRFPNTVSDDSEDAYTELTTGSAGLTAIMLFVRAQIQHRIADVMSADVGVGVQAMGNKGAIGLRISWRTADSPTSNSLGGTGEDIMNLTFVAAHLAPMEEALERRNQDFLDIVAGLVFEHKTLKETSSVSSSSSSKINSPREGNGEEDEPLLSTNPDDEPTNPSTKLIGIYEPDTHLFFAGDLNYRTSITRPAADGSDTPSFPQPTADTSSPHHYSHLLARDQLTTQLRSNKTLHGLTEPAITFPPTYKYSPRNCASKDIMLDTEVSKWQWSTHRWPSWCDRILHSPTEITVKTYTALPLLSTSDHRPVALSASLPLRPVKNPHFAAHRPIDLNVNWKADRQAAKLKEAVVGTVWHSVSTGEGLFNLTMGVAAVVCFAVLATVYSREW